MLAKKWSDLKAGFPQACIFALVGAVFVIISDLVFGYWTTRGILNNFLIPGQIKVFIYCFDFCLVYFILLGLRVLSIFWGNHFLGAVLALLLFLYLISWATFLLVGQFLGFEGVRFVAHNIGDLIWIIGQVSPWYHVFLILFIILPFWGYLITIKAGNSAKEVPGSHFQMALAVLGTFAIFCFIIRFVQNPSNHLKSILICKVSPHITLLFDPRNDFIPADFDPGRDYLDARLDKIISWEEYQRQKSPAPRSSPVILIVIESLRADILDHDKIMPNLYALKSDGQLFRAYANSNQTDYSWPSLLSSQYPLRTSYHYYYPPRMGFPRVMIYDVFKHGGYKTALFSAQNENWGGMANYLNTEFLDTFNYSNENQEGLYTPMEDGGFGLYVRKYGGFGKIDDEVVVNKALAWAGHLITSKFFMTLNFQRPHYPYTWPENFHPPLASCPPQMWNYKPDLLPLMRNRYINALQYTDLQIGKVIAFLKSRGLYDDSIIVVLGDHGEAFYEHGQTVHSNVLYNETALTTLVIKSPKGSPELNPGKIPELLDLAPTVCSLAGLRPHPAFQGEDWLALQRGTKPVFITVNSPLNKQNALIQDNWKYIVDERNNFSMLFDLKKDPGERNNLLRQYPDIANELAYKLYFWKKKQLHYYQDTKSQKYYYPPKFLDKVK